MPFKGDMGIPISSAHWAGFKPNRKGPIDAKDRQPGHHPREPFRARMFRPRQAEAQEVLRDSSVWDWCHKKILSYAAGRTRLAGTGGVSIGARSSNNGLTTV